MKFVQEEILIDRVPKTKRALIDKARNDIKKAILGIHHPAGSGSFTIHPESGKKSGQGNGVRPIRDAFVSVIGDIPGWKTEEKVAFSHTAKPGPVDAALFGAPGELFCVEWETGNISSCHRSLNKLAFAVFKGVTLGAAIIVPTRAMYKFLTDRVASYSELVPYIAYWKAFSAATAEGYLSIFVVEHDATSTAVPRIRKGTDGRALR